MEVRFRTRQLARCHERYSDATKAWGAEVARRYVERINLLSRARSAHDLSSFAALAFHPLTGPRRGQYAIRLTGSMRLIVTFEDRAMTVVRIEEVSKHYGD